MVEFDNHLKLFLISILDMYKAFEHVDMLSIGKRFSHLLHVLGRMYPLSAGTAAAHFAPPPNN
jgi:hypothetical protein